MGGGTAKNNFLNPIIQNEIHIEWLKKYLSGLTEGPYFSIIVFSKRCVLKNIQISKNSAHVVIQRYDLLRTIQKMATGQMVYTSDQIALIYERLYPLTQTTNEQKNQHIQNINHKIYSEEKNFVSIIRTHSSTDRIYCFFGYSYFDQLCFFFYRLEYRAFV